jgi:hypothetical protein
MSHETPRRSDTSAPLPVAHIEQVILLLRGERVILDVDLAILYGVSTGVLIQAMKRNLERFPRDFMFQLTAEEFAAVKARPGSMDGIGTHGGRRHPPYAFTEHGVAMLSGVLRSRRAVQVNIEIMRAFVRLRRLLATHEDLARKLDELERRYDGHFRVVFDTIRQLMSSPTVPARRRIGFGPEDRGGSGEGS